MPRSYQAYPQNAVVTHTPANAGTGTGNSSPNSALNQGRNTFQIPSLLDACAGVTNGTANPFVSGLNTMGQGTGSTTNVGGQTGNIMSGFQIFVDALCGSALGTGTGGLTVSQALQAARSLRAQGGDLKKTIQAIRHLRESLGPGTTPQTVLAGVDAVTTLVNGNPIAQSAISTGQTAAGVSGNQVIDAMNGGQTMADQGHQMLTGQSATGASGTDLLNAGGTAMGVNNANHAGHQALTPATAVALKDQGLLTANDFSASYMVAADPTGHWAWDGTDGAPSTGTLGCLKVTPNSRKLEYLSSEVPVVAGENVELSCQLKTAGLTYTGSNPLALCVQKYRKSKTAAGATVFNDVGGYDAQTITPAATADWTGYASTYTVEPGVDHIRLKFKVNPNATGGTVKFDDADTLKLDLIADEAVPGLGITTDSIVNQVYGVAGSGFTHNDAANALGSNSTALMSLTSRVAALEAEGHTGAIAGDDFNWSGQLLANSNWGGAYSNFTWYGTPNGYYQGENGYVDWVGRVPISPQSGHFDWRGTDAVSTTDYQLIQLILRSAPQTDYANHAAFIYLYGRISADWSSYVRAAVGSDGTYSVSYNNGGGVITMASGLCPVPGRGSLISLYCGDKPTTALHHFRLEVGSAILCDFTESGTSSLTGTGNRKWGWGLLAQDNTFDSGGVPPDVDQWLAMDQ